MDFKTALEKLEKGFSISLPEWHPITRIYKSKGLYRMKAPDLFDAVRIEDYPIKYIYKPEYVERQDWEIWTMNKIKEEIRNNNKWIS